MPKEKFTPEEMMVVATSRELKDGETVFVGVGFPIVAALLAKYTHAPNLIMVFESGVMGAKLPRRIPLSIADPCLVTGCPIVVSMFEIFAEYLQIGMIDVGIISGAQVDKYGNVNSTVVGNYLKPKLRLPGSGGAYEISSHAKRIIITMPHEKRRFPEKVDFITSPGYLSGGNERERMALPGSGPSAVISTLGVFRFDKKTKEMYLETYHRGVTIQQIKENVGWDLKISKDVHETEPATPEEIKLLREEIDPHGIYLKHT